MKRKFLTNLIFLLFLNLLVKPFWIFGIDRSVQNLVGAEEYGMYFSLLSFSLLLNILLDLGITNFNNRSVSRNPRIISKYFSKIVPLKFLLSFVYAAIVIISGIALGYTNGQFKLLYWLIFNNFLLSFILYLRSNISGLHLFKTDSFLSVLDRLIMILICSLLLWGNITDKPFTINWFIGAQTFSYLITLLISLFVVIYKTGRVKLAFNIQYGYKILRKSYPFALLILLMSVFNRVDSVMIERILPDGKVQAGIYAQAFRLLDAASMYAFLFAGLLLPMFSRMLKNKESIAPLLKLSFSLLLIPAIILVISSIFFGKDLISLLYREHIETSSRIFLLLIISSLFIFTTYLFGTLLTANGNLQSLNILAAGTLFLNLGLNFLLIPKFKAEGAAYASIASQGFFAVSQLFLSKRIFNFGIDWETVSKLFIISGCLVVCGLLLKFYCNIHIAGFLFLSLLGILFSLLFRIFIWKEAVGIIGHKD